MTREGVSGARMCNEKLSRDCDILSVPHFVDSFTHFSVVGYWRSKKSSFQGCTAIHSQIPYHRVGRRSS